jgi:hypothetical protein
MAPLAEGQSDPAGEVGLQVIRGGRVIEVDPGKGLEIFDEVPDRATTSLAEIITHGFPQAGLSEPVNRWRRSNLGNLWRGLWRVRAAQLLGVPHFYGALFLRVFNADGEVTDLGLASMRLITDNGMGFVVDAFQNLVELENMKFHGFGIGTGAESASDTALGTEFTTEYVSNNTRPTGTTAEASQKVYQTVATFSPDSGGTLAVTEHGVFDQAANSGGVLLDRSKFSAVNLVASSDSLQATYQATFNSGG